MGSLLVVGTWLLVLPQSGPAKPAATPQPSSELSRIRTDENGWPVWPITPGKRAAEKTPPAPTPAPAVPPAAPPGGTSPAVQGTVPVRAATGSQQPVGNRLRSPLMEIYRRIGMPADLEGLRCAVARLKVRVLDGHSGATVAERELFHEADLSVPRRDRLVFSANRKIYGRDGAGAWVRFYDMLWPSLEAEARQELEMYGLMLRFPWGFADTEEWVTYPSENGKVRGQERVVIRVERRADRPDAPQGPSPVRRDVDRFDIYCDPARMEPREVRYRLAGGAAVDRWVLLSDYRALGRVRLPVRRVFANAAGTPKLEIEIERIDAELDLPRKQFHPPER